MRQGTFNDLGNRQPERNFIDSIASLIRGGAFETAVDQIEKRIARKGNADSMVCQAVQMIVEPLCDGLKPTDHACVLDFLATAELSPPLVAKVLQRFLDPRKHYPLVQHLLSSRDIGPGIGVKPEIGRQLTSLLLDVAQDEAFFGVLPNYFPKTQVTACKRWLLPQELFTHDLAQALTGFIVRALDARPILGEPTNRIAPIYRSLKPALIAAQDFEALSRIQQAAQRAIADRHHVRPHSARDICDIFNLPVPQWLFAIGLHDTARPDIAG